MPDYLLTAIQTPALMAPSALIDPTADPATPNVLEAFTTGQTSGVALALNQNARHLENLGRFGGGGWAVVYGLDLSAGTGLTLNISEGLAIIDGAVKRTATTAALADNTRTHLWLTQAGSITQKTDLTQPASSAVYLGSALTSGGAITSVDYSGRQSAFNGLPYRRTADTGKPADSPSSQLRYYHETDAGLFFWDGSRYTTVDAQTMPSNIAVTSADVTLTSDQARNNVLKCTGTLTGNRSLIVPTWAGRTWVVINATSGSYTLTVKTSGGTGIVVAQGKVAHLACDGTNVIDCVTNNAIAGTPTDFTQSYSTTATTVPIMAGTPPSSAYTGAADGEAKLADLNTLRAQVVVLGDEILINRQLINALIDLLETYGQAT